LTFSEITVSVGFVGVVGVILLSVMAHHIHNSSANHLNHCSIKKSTFLALANDFHTSILAHHFAILCKSHFQVRVQSTQLTISDIHSILEYVSANVPPFLL
jgi:hypothetical protein